MSQYSFTKKQWLILFSVWLAFMVSFVARLSWSTIMPVALPALQFTLAEGSLYISAFYWGYVLTVLPGGMLVDRLGYRKVILTCLILMIAFTVPMFWVTTYGVGFVLRFVLGISCGPLHAACMSAIADYFSMRERGRAVGLYMTASSFGLSFVNFMAPRVATTFGWNYTFLGVAIVIAGIFLVSLVNIPKKESISSISEKKNSSIFVQLREVMSYRSLWLLAFTGLFATGTSWGVASWANQYMSKELGMSIVAAGTVMMIYGIAAMVAKPIAGFLADTLRMRPNYVAAMFIAFLTPSLFLFVSTPKGEWLYVSGAILGVGAFAYSAITNMLAITVAPQELRGTSVGFINVFNQIGSASAPMLLSKIVLATGSYRTSLMVLAIFPIIAALALFFVKVERDK